MSDPGAEEHYEYVNEVEWTQGRRGRLSSSGLEDIVVASPPEFGGEAGVWNPEQMLLGAANACLMVTFVAVALKMRLAWTGYRCAARAHLGRGADGKYAITRIEYFPRVTVADPLDAERARRALEKAEANCLIAHSLKYPGTVTPTVEAAAAPAPPPAR